MKYFNQHDQNFAQAALRHAGEKSLGDKASESTASEVRKAGLRHLGGRVALAATVVLPSAGLIYELGTQPGPHTPTKQEQIANWDQNSKAHPVGQVPTSEFVAPTPASIPPAQQAK